MGTVVLLTLAYKPDSVRRWIAPHTDLSPCPDKGNCAKLIYRGIVPQDIARVKQETQYIVFIRGAFYRCCGSAYSFTNRPMGQMWVKPGVEMYQQPGPSGFWLISKVISRHPSGKSARKVSPAWIPRPLSSKRGWGSVSSGAGNWICPSLSLFMIEPPRIINTKKKAVFLQPTEKYRSRKKERRKLPKNGTAIRKVSIVQ